MDFTNLEQTTDHKPPRLVVYGTGGSGKSTFTSGAPSTIFMDIEDGLDGIDCAKQRVHEWPDVIEMIEKLHEQDHKFQTVGVDSIDWLEGLIWKQVAAENKVASIGEIPYGRGYDYAIDLWKQFLSGMTSLRNNKNMTIVLIAHDKIKRFDDPMTDGYDRYMLKLHDKAAALVYEWADGVLFLKEKTLIKSEEGKFNKKVKKGIGGGIYMHTTETPAYQAKHRKSLSLPDEFPIGEETGWQDFINAIQTRND